MTVSATELQRTKSAMAKLDQNQFTLAVCEALIHGGDDDGRRGRRPRHPPKSPTEFLRVFAMFQRAVLALADIDDAERMRFANSMRDIADEVERGAMTMETTV